jgi:hypothetical protein
MTVIWWWWFFLTVAIRAIKPMRIKILITRLCYFLNTVSQKVIGHKELDDLKAYMTETMCMLEMYFSPPFCDDPWVLADRVTQVFYILDPETGKHVVVSAKQKNFRVENVEDNYDDVNQFEEMPLFTSPMNIKHIKISLTRSLCPICEKVAM